MIRLVVSDEARLDAIEAALWYEAQRPGLGSDFELCLEASLNHIVRHPHHCEKRYNEIRVRFMDRFPYGIHYTIEAEAIYVFGIFHTHLSPNNWYDRKK